MAHFWLATFPIDVTGGGADVVPLLPVGAKCLAIEVLRDGEEWAVLLSTADDPHAPRLLTCHLGFTNMAKACNVWLDRGFPLVDAGIDTSPDGVLRVTSPFFGRARKVMQYEDQILEISGVDLSPTVSTHSSLVTQGPTLAPSYWQHRQVPDSAQPNALIAREPVAWSAARLDVRPLAGAHVRFDPGASLSRCPALATLASHPMEPARVWTGNVNLSQADENRMGGPKAPRVAEPQLGAPAFRFEDVEVLGFRINLAEQDIDIRRELERLIRPLNFHLNEPSIAGNGNWRTASSDFRYRVATSTIVIELLRYGRMKALRPAPPLETDDSQGQHELLVRFLVGRVDDDSAQARSPAVYVPAIFVDNPWSKVLGRDAAGFDKRMAHFYVKSGDELKRLLPDGRLAGSSPGQSPSKPEPLATITHVELVNQADARGEPMFELSLPPGAAGAALDPVDVSLTLGTSPLAGTRWQQTDFNDVAFRRSFAGQAIAENLARLRMIQVAPVSTRGTLEPTLITGTFRFRGDLRVALPTGTAIVTLRSVSPKNPSAAATPPAWNALCTLLGGTASATVPVPSGSWYRLLCSMDLVIDDGLDWSAG